MGQQRLEKKRNCICINWKVIPGRETTKPKRVVCHPRWAIGLSLTNWSVLKRHTGVALTLFFVVYDLTTKVFLKHECGKHTAKKSRTSNTLDFQLLDLQSWQLMPRDLGVEYLEIHLDLDLSFRRNVVGEYEATQYQNGGSHFSTPPGIIIPTTDIDRKR